VQYGRGHLVIVEVYPRKSQAVAGGELAQAPGVRCVARADELHAGAEKQQRLASAEQRLYQQLAERSVGFDDRLHCTAQHADDRTRFHDDEGGVYALAGQKIEFGDEVTRPVEEERSTASVVNVGTLDLSIEHDHQVVREVAGGSEDLPIRGIFYGAVRFQRSQLLVGQFGEQTLGVLGRHQIRLEPDL
jgi:hypothetical protein